MRDVCNTRPAGGRCGSCGGQAARTITGPRDAVVVVVVVVVRSKPFTNVTLVRHVATGQHERKAACDAYSGCPLAVRPIA